MQYSFFFHGNSGYSKAPQCYVLYISALLVLLRFVLYNKNLDYKIRDDVIGTACGKYSEDKIIPCLISGFRCEVDENCAFLRFYKRSSQIHITFWWENVTARSFFENLNGKVISNLILQKYDGRVWTGFIWFCMESLWAFRVHVFHKMLGI